MKISRRGFLKGSPAALGGLLWSPGNAQVTPPEPHFDDDARPRTVVSSFVCPFCSVGCGLIGTIENGKLTGVEGDRDHPINRGAVCAKALALPELAVNRRRITQVRYRAPGSTRWEDRPWEWALEKIANNVRAVRESSFQERDGSTMVNRCPSLAVVCGGMLRNEEGYLLAKLARSLGMLYLEGAGVLGAGASQTGLSATIGWGAATNPVTDLRGSDCILVIGANPAENHPVAFRWIEEALGRGAGLISVDPRMTRTGKRASLHAPIRPGSDIAFLGGLINYVLEYELYNREYLSAFTDAGVLVRSDFDFQDGYFNGFSQENLGYAPGSWQYLRESVTPAPGIQARALEDPTLENPRAVLQLLRAHFSRYDVETVSRLTGLSPEAFTTAANAFAATGAPGRAGAIVYGAGLVQHTTGTQAVRACAILQLLLGNLGMAGGGLHPVFGSGNSQGVRDAGVSPNHLPGYLPIPNQAQHPSLKEYIQREAPDQLYLRGRGAALVSLLKAWWGTWARRDNDYAYDYLPKSNGSYDWITLFETARASALRGMMVFGANPAVSGPNQFAERDGLDRLDWLVVSDLWETETANFWQRPGTRASAVKTEVFLLPASCSMEKGGSLTCSSRWIQWSDALVEPPGEARSDAWILNRLMAALRRVHTRSTAQRDEPFLRMSWDYGDDTPDLETVAQEVNGVLAGTYSGLSEPGALRDDGSTACGNWLYTGFHRDRGSRLCAGRDDSDPSRLGLHPRWSFSWPRNTRILGNRASADSNGRAWDYVRTVVQWDPAQRRWVGNDVPDFPSGRAPTDGANPTGQGTDALGGRAAFWLMEGGRARLFAVSGVADGPLPEHYEPFEGPVVWALSGILNPAARRAAADLYPVGDPSQFPILATTFRLAEHLQTGSMTRNLSRLTELVSLPLVEISRTLAAARGISTGNRITVTSARGELTAVALVTPRLRPLVVDGQPFEVIALPLHWGFTGTLQGHGPNYLTTHIGDASSFVPELKAFLVDISRV